MKTSDDMLSGADPSPEKTQEAKAAENAEFAAFLDAEEPVNIGAMPVAPVSASAEEEIERRVQDLGFDEKVKSTSTNERIQDLQQQLGALDASPEKRYRDTLDKNDIPWDVAMDVIHMTLVSGEHYTRGYYIGKKKQVKVVFRTRTPRSQNEIDAEMAKLSSGMSFAGRSRVEGLRTISHSIASVTREESTTTFDATHEGRTQAAAYLSELPFPLYGAIANKFDQFQKLISVVFSPGYEENF